VDMTIQSLQELLNITCITAISAELGEKRIYARPLAVVERKGPRRPPKSVGKPMRAPDGCILVPVSSSRG
jgi:hypothetical protein